MIDYLDPEIAGEGISAEEWIPDVPEARIPDYRGIKPIQKYFPALTGRPYQHQVFPCWFYHPDPKVKPRLIGDVYNGETPPRRIKSAVEEARKIGCTHRATTMEERAQGFPLHRWEYSGEWRATPFHTAFNPAEPGPGKTIVAPAVNSSAANADMIAAVVAAVQKGSAGAASADPDWTEFQAYKDWKAAQKAGERLMPVQVYDPENTANALASEPPAPGPDLVALREEAARRGVKVDGRWGIDRIQAELEGAGQG